MTKQVLDIESPRKPVLIEGATGAQVLPVVGDERSKVGAFSAYLCCSADMRKKFPATYGALAADLFIVSVEC